MRRDEISGSVEMTEVMYGGRVMYGGKLQRKMRIVDDGDVVAGNFLEARELY